MKEKFKFRIKIPKQIHLQMLDDLNRPHPFAFERVGFLYTTSILLKDNTVIILAKDYIAVDDENYIEDKNVGAKINSTAIRIAMQKMLDNNEGCFHVHLHSHKGIPYPSYTDNKGLPNIAKSFSNISKFQANGYVILSENSFNISILYADEELFFKPELISIIGYPLKLQFSLIKRNKTNKILDRQSFLGETSQFLFENIKVGIVGYGGGGSHIGQQLAHLGVTNIVVFDNDIVEESNLNRLIGAWYSDLKNSVFKTTVAKRIIKKILPKANVTCVNNRWQENPELIQKCDIVIGCIDSYSERQQIESECRRYLIPYIDIGMDVYKIENEPYSMSGQIILSMPNSPCMNCFGFITEKKIGIEAAKYGNAGGRPQVVWANGVLASTAVGIFVDLITGWTGLKDRLVYLSYDANSGTINEHIRLKHCDDKCVHYNPNEIGIPKYIRL